MATEKATKYKGSELIRTSTGTTRDILNVILNPDEFYSSEEVAKKIQNFMKKEVPADGRRNMGNSK